MAKKEFREAIKLIEEGKNAYETSKKLSRSVNSMSFKPEENVLYLNNKKADIREKFSEISVKWLFKLEYMYRKGFYDGRNQRASELSSKLVSNGLEHIGSYRGYVLYIRETGGVFPEDLTDIQAYREDVHPKWLEDVTYLNLLVECLSTDHRTLQQTFTGLVFYWLYYGDVGKKYKKVQKQIRTIMEPHELGLPLV